VPVRQPKKNPLKTLKTLSRRPWYMSEHRDLPAEALRCRASLTILRRAAPVNTQPRRPWAHRDALYPKVGAPQPAFRGCLRGQESAQRAGEHVVLPLGQPKIPLEIPNMPSNASTTKSYVQASEATSPSSKSLYGLGLIPQRDIVRGHEAHSGSGN
jgi:hypothetical protein